MHFQRLRLLLVVALCAGLLTACDSGEKDGRPDEKSKDNIPPEVQSRYPDSDEQRIEPDDEIRIVFNELMDETSLTTDSGIQLYSGEEDASEGLMVEEREQTLLIDTIVGLKENPESGELEDTDFTRVTITPASGRFSLDTPYTLKVLSTVKDRSEIASVHPITGRNTTGNFVARDVSVIFTVEDGAFNVNRTKVIDFASSADSSALPSSFDHQLASNRNGLTVMVWRSVIDGRSLIKASRFITETKTWALLGDASVSSEFNAEVLSDYADTSAFTPKVAVNDQGQAIAVWHQAASPGAESSVWANIFDGQVWLGAQRISAQASGFGTSEVEAVIAQSGIITVAWREAVPGTDPNGQYSAIVTHRFVPSSGDLASGEWEPSYYRTAIADEISASPRLVARRDGVVVMSWVQALAGNKQLYTARFLPATGWTEPKLISSGSSTDIVDPLLALSPSNDGFTAWRQFDGTRYNLWLASYVSGAWRPAILLENDDRGDVNSLSLVAGHDGQAIVSWVQSSGTTQRLLGKVYDTRLGWHETEELSRITNGVLLAPNVAIDREGNGLVVWQNGTNLSRVHAARYSELSGWKTSKLIENLGAGGTGPLVRPLLEDGRMIVVWKHFDGARHRLAYNLFKDAP